MKNEKITICSACNKVLEDGDCGHKMSPVTFSTREELTKNSNDFLSDFFPSDYFPLVKE